MLDNTLLPWAVPELITAAYRKFFDRESSHVKTPPNQPGNVITTNVRTYGDVWLPLDYANPDAGSIISRVKTAS